MSGHLSTFDIVSIVLGGTLWAIVLSASPSWSVPCRALAVLYLVLESCWYMLSKYRYHIFNREIERYPDEERVNTVMKWRFTSLYGVFALDEFVQGWFMASDMKAAEIPRGNIDEFVAYGFFCLNYDELEDAKRAQVNAFVNEVEARWNVRFPQGYDASLKFMAHVWEPLRVHHKPLVAYLAAEFTAQIAHIFLRLMGFGKKNRGRVVTWVSSTRRSSSFFFFRKALAADDRDRNIASDVKINRTIAISKNPTCEDRSDHKANAPLKTHEVSEREAEEWQHGNSNLDAACIGRKSIGSPHARHKVHLPQDAREITHHVVEHAFDAALAATSTAAAALSQQYPHPGQQYPMGHHHAISSVPTTVHSPRARSPKTMVEPKQDDHHQDGDLSQESNVAIVFLHGVGFGVLPYLHFLSDIMKACPDSPVAVLEMPHVALRFCREALEVDQVAASAIAAVEGMGCRQACFVGHSYGTFVISRILQLYPEYVHSAALLDPVCLLTCYPQLLYNFIYRTMKLSEFSSPLALFDAARFVCSRDLAISQAFCRKFHWSELMLWPEDLPPREGATLICLSGKDDLVPSELVISQFDGSTRATIMYHPDLGHGGLLMNAGWLQKIVENIRCMVCGTDEENCHSEDLLSTYNVDTATSTERSEADETKKCM